MNFRKDNIDKIDKKYIKIKILENRRREEEAIDETMDKDRKWAILLKKLTHIFGPDLIKNSNITQESWGNTSTFPIQHVDTESLFYF